MSSVIYNASAGSCFYDTSGSAITSQPKLGGAVLGAGSTVSVFDYVGFGNTENSFQGSRVYATSKTGVLTAKLGASVNITSVASVGGFAKYTLNSHSLVVGDIINISGDTAFKVNGPQRITAKGTNDFISDKVYASGSTGSLAYRKISGSLAYGTGVGNRYSILRKVNTTINNVANTAMQSGAAPDAYRKSPKNLMGARTEGTALAIRNSYWSIYLGKWTTNPTATNTSLGNVAGSTLTDTSTDNAVTSRSVAGELVYRYGAAAAANADYNLPTA